MVSADTGFSNPPRDGFSLSELLGRVCWKHGRFTFDCGCEPEEEITVVKNEPTNPGAVVSAEADGVSSTFVRVYTSGGGWMWRDAEFKDALPRLNYHWHELENITIQFAGLTVRRPEPGFGAVVMANSYDGRMRYVRADNDSTSWRGEDGTGWKSWDELKDVEILREGLPS